MTIPNRAVILAGGFGTRLSEETGVRPKPMVEIGGKPILWHILKIFAAYGVEDFVICCGYKGHMIKEYFANYHLHSGTITYDLRSGEVQCERHHLEAWRITLVDTGAETLTGGRLKRVADYLGAEPFFFTYGDGVSDVDLQMLAEFHGREGALATVTAVQPPGRFGAFTLGEGQLRVADFREKPSGDGEAAWINGGFFILDPAVVDYIDGDEVAWERAPMERLAAQEQLAAFRHTGFWHPMDTLRDRMVLEELWNSGKAPWKVW
jgi:glucose-1-phosphate cytidylyltransferase